MSLSFSGKFSARLAIEGGNANIMHSIIAEPIDKNKNVNQKLNGNGNLLPIDHANILPPTVGAKPLDKEFID